MDQGVAVDKLGSSEQVLVLALLSLPMSQKSETAGLLLWISSVYFGGLFASDPLLV